MPKKKYADAVFLSSLMGVSLMSLILISLVYFEVPPITDDRIRDFFMNNEDINASKVYFMEDDFELLQSRYKADREEFIYCLYGSTGDNHYFVKGMEEVPYYSDERSVTHKRCLTTGSYLGTIHSHPGGSCMLSYQDVYSFGGDGAVITCIICGMEKINCYESDDFYDPLAYDIIEGADKNAN